MTSTADRRPHSRDSMDVENNNQDSLSRSRTRDSLHSRQDQPPTTPQRLSRAGTEATKPYDSEIIHMDTSRGGTPARETDSLAESRLGEEDALSVYDMNLYTAEKRLSSGEFVRRLLQDDTQLQREVLTWRRKYHLKPSAPHVINRLLLADVLQLPDALAEDAPDESPPPSPAPPPPGPTPDHGTPAARTPRTPRTPAAWTPTPRTLASRTSASRTPTPRTPARKTSTQRTESRQSSKQEPDDYYAGEQQTGVINF